MIELKLRKPLPKNRTFEQVKRHYLVEKGLAERLKELVGEERKQFYATMYDELFRQVPDHPRLTKREDARLTLEANRGKFAILKRYVNKSTVFAEFAPGDCRFVLEVARYVSRAYGIDISDQRNPDDVIPENFKLIIYDGYSVDGIDENTVDVFFSDYLIEHLHPDETKAHFKIVYRLLKEGGKYIFRTPHAFTGPHDISQYFCEEPEGFHLKEWTYTELKQVIKEAGYSKLYTYWSAKGINIKIANSYFELYEKVIGLFPKRYTRMVSRFGIPSILCEIVK